MRKGNAAPPSAPGPPLGAGADLVRLGTLIGTHGLAGGLKLRLDNPDSTALERLTRVFVRRDGNQTELKIRTLAPAGRNLKVTFAGVDAIDAAEGLKGGELLVLKQDLPQIEKDQFYYFELIGFTVRSHGGSVVGEIREIFHNGANDVWVVVNGEREVMVPVIADVVESIDRENRSATIALIPGLLD